MQTPEQAMTTNSDHVSELEKMLLVITRSLVDHPEEIVVFPAPGEGFVHFEVRTDNRDVGTLIGRRGSHADAIRLLMMAAGGVRKMRVTLQIMSRDGEDHTNR